MYSRSIGLLTLFLVAVSSPVAAVWGIPDQVPAATLVAPFLEAGANPATHPEDTLTTVYSRSGTVLVHWTIWTIDGEPALGGNRTIGSAATWSQSFRGVLTDASPATRALLLDGDVYRGFMTVDVVTDATDLTPFDADYPFGHTNALIGASYFVRLAEGSANGLAMMPIEAVATGTSSFLSGFYAASGGGGRREEIDANARHCIQLRGAAEACMTSNVNTDEEITSLRARVWQNDGSLDISSRFIVFAWNTLRPDEGGPSVRCDDLGCAATYTLLRTREDGTILAPVPTRLDHVVNVIDITGSNGAGEVLLGGIPDPDDSLQIFAFTFNSAKPEGTGQNWDAVFEANIQVED